MIDEDDADEIIVLQDDGTSEIDDVAGAALAYEMEVHPVAPEHARPLDVTDETYFIARGLREEAYLGEGSELAPCTPGAAAKVVAARGVARVPRVLSEATATRLHAYVLGRFELLSNAEFDIRKEAAYALCNALLGGSMATVSGLVYLGVLPSLCSCLTSPDVDLIHTVLDALGAALEAGEIGRQSAPPGAPNACVQQIDECGGVEKLEELQQHENAAVYEKAGRLLDEYFADQGDAVEDVQIAPRATADSFVFGAPGGASASGAIVLAAAAPGGGGVPGPGLSLS